MFGYSRYIGIPFKDHGRGFDGCDCWGLVKLVLKEKMGLETPDFGDNYFTAYDRDVVDNLLHQNSNTNWNFDVTEMPRQELDILIFCRGGIETHVGLFIKDNIMLHVIDGTNSCLQRFDVLMWKRRFSRAVRPVVDNKTFIELTNGQNAR